MLQGTSFFTEWIGSFCFLLLYRWNPVTFLYTQKSSHIQKPNRELRGEKISAPQLQHQYSCDVPGGRPLSFISHVVLRSLSLDGERAERKLILILARRRRRAPNGTKPATHFSRACMTSRRATSEGRNELWAPPKGRVLSLGGWLGGCRHNERTHSSAARTAQCSFFWERRRAAAAGETKYMRRTRFNFLLSCLLARSLAHSPARRRFSRTKHVRGKTSQAKCWWCMYNHTHAEPALKTCTLRLNFCWTNL